MSVGTSSSSDTEKTFMNKLLHDWDKQKDSEKYDAVNFLIKLSKKFEKLTLDYYKQDPDPFDNRHPASTVPGCGLEKLLLAFTKHEENVFFLDTLIDKYLMHGQSNILREGQTMTLTAAAARLLLAIMPGIDAINTLTEKNSDVMGKLYEWAEKADEPLCTYAVGLLSHVVDQKEVNELHKENHITLVPILLKRLCQRIKTSSCSSQVPVPSAKETPCKRQSLDSKLKGSASKKRKGNDESAKKYKFRKLDNQSCPNSIKSNKNEDVTDRNNCKVADKLNSVPSLGELDSEVSNSSWTEMMPVVIGCGFSLAPPLSDDLANYLTLKLLTPFGEFQDLLSVFLEHKVLDLIHHFLDHSNVNNGLLTFSALNFLAFLLIHNKIATDFIENGGIQKLLSIRRPSLGASGVSLCIYYLAYNVDVMEHVCQLSPKVLQSLVRYAMWLLECSHEYGRCHAALFFSLSFQYRTILKIFDQKKGLRYLVNLISTLSSMGNDVISSVQSNGSDASNHSIENDDEYTNKSSDSRPITKSACAALKKYFETHLIIKAKNLKNLKDQSSSNCDVITSEKDDVIEAFDFLLNINSTFMSWYPLTSFIEMDGIRILLKLVSAVSNWSNYNSRSDIARMTLDCLAVLALSDIGQKQFCEQADTSWNYSKETGIGVIVGVVDGDRFFDVEPEIQMAALTVIINCVSKSISKGNTSHEGRQVEKKDNEVTENTWQAVKNENGIMILLELLNRHESPTHSDEIRLLACKALCGLSRCKSVKQILSKLPLFNNGQATSLTRQPIMPDRKRIHTKFCKYMDELTERVSGKSMTLHLDLDIATKEKIVSQTVIRYDNRQLLQLIHNHLKGLGLYSTASSLLAEASLLPSANSGTPLLNTPKNQLRNNGSGDGFLVSPSPSCRKISFSRGDHASGTPTFPPHSSQLFTPTQKKGKFRFQVDPTFSDPFHFSSNGNTTVTKGGLLHGDGVFSKPQPLSLNTIVAGYLKNQHAQCKNPVVTVPEFSLFRHHSCPESRVQVKTPVNMSARCFQRQVVPTYGSYEGAKCDRQFIYSRYRPNHLFRPVEGNSPYTCCTFVSDQHLVTGDCDGNLTVHGLHSEEDPVIEGAAPPELYSIEVGIDNKTCLLISGDVMQTTCNLFSLDTLDGKYTFNDIHYCEFAKTTTERVIGTRQAIATIFDTKTRQQIQSFSRLDISNNYSANKATFSPDDCLILSDGLLWDVRASNTKHIHKFDKFDSRISGIFHPNGMEVIINSEIWDLRNYHLLHTVPSIDRCSLKFNYNASVMYAFKSVRESEYMRKESQSTTTFQTLDARDYSSISVTYTKHQIYDLAVDNRDFLVGAIQRQCPEMPVDYPSPKYMTLCRLYRVGRIKGDEEDEDDFDPLEEESNDEDDYGEDGSEIFEDFETDDSSDEDALSMSESDFSDMD